MPSTIAQSSRGLDILGLDLTVEQRLAIVDEVIRIHNEAPHGRGRDQHIKEEVMRFAMQAGSRNPDAAEFIEKKLRPGGDDPVPLDHDRHPGFFQPHQQGRSPITLKEMKANYERVIAEKGDQ